MLLCRNNATINVHVKTQNRVKHLAKIADPWPRDLVPSLQYGLHSYFYYRADYIIIVTTTIEAGHLQGF